MDRVRDALAPVVSEVMLIANDANAATWLPQASVRADAYPGAGGMAGVHAALSAGHDVLAVAWDMPFVTTALLRLIRDTGAASGADACIPESDSPHGIEPFCAWYSRAALPSLETFLRDGGGAARDFLRTVKVFRIPTATIRAVGEPGQLFLSVNTADDLARARDTASQ